MSTQTIRIRPTLDVPASLTCDRCQTVYDARGSHPSDRQQPDSADRFETQEFLRWQSVGGYSSIFGDGSRLELDLCQGCVKAVLGEWLRVIPEEG